jgi:hypothetical protein
VTRSLILSPSTFVPITNNSIPSFCVVYISSHRNQSYISAKKSRSGSRIWPLAYSSLSALRCFGLIFHVINSSLHFLLIIKVEPTAHALHAHSDMTMRDKWQRGAALSNWSRVPCKQRASFIFITIHHSHAWDPAEIGRKHFPPLDEFRNADNADLIHFKLVRVILLHHLRFEATENHVVQWCSIQLKRAIVKREELLIYCCRCFSSSHC